MRGSRSLFWFATAMTIAIVGVGLFWKGPIALLLLIPYAAIVAWPALATRKEKGGGATATPESPLRAAVHPVDRQTPGPPDR